MRMQSLCPGSHQGPGSIVGGTVPAGRGGHSVAHRSEGARKDGGFSSCSAERLAAISGQGQGTDASVKARSFWMQPGRREDSVWDPVGGLRRGARLRWRSSVEKQIDQGSRAEQVGAAFLCSLQGSCSVRRQTRGFFLGRPQAAQAGYEPFAPTYILLACSTHRGTRGHTASSFQLSCIAVSVQFLFSVYILCLRHYHWKMSPVVYHDSFFSPM